MNPDLDKLEAIFDRARQLPSTEARAAYLAMACEGDEALQKRVEAMLNDEARAREFFEQGAAAAGDAAADSSSVLGERVRPEGPGSVIDRYKLLEKIGEGGMGVVYLAAQEQPVRRRVALKIIKLGMDTKQVVARFEAERQALALMEHPNIARVLDGGATEAGRPYFVMELVRGLKLTDFCNQNHLPTRQRLDLFIQVCGAVQHAHQKGIIHRDLKPSNILVTVNDGVAVPKVIDFGIAKATEVRLTDKTVYTGLYQFMGTPAYMSPEQTELTSVDVDTRSDIYSLGVLLYELLTDRTPFEHKELLQAGLDAMRQTIRTQEPPRPSTRLSTLAAADLTRIAQARGSEPPELVHLLRGDLDWIVMKCLEKDRARRYETTSALAMDLQRHLEGEPVSAVPPSKLYRITKWVRKNRGLVTAGIVVAVSIVCGLVLSTWQWSVARHNERVARTESLRNAQTAQFLADMLRGVDPSVARGEDTRLLRQILDTTARRLGRDLKGEPDVEADLRSILGDVYLGLGNYSNAASMYHRALDLRTNLFGPVHLKVSASLQNLGEVAWREGHYPEAEKLQIQALEMRTNLLGAESAKVADSLDGLGQVRWYAGQWAQAEDLLRRALAMRRKLLGDLHPDTVKSLEDLAGLLSAGDKFRDAEPLQREALRLNQQLLGADDPAVASSLNNLSDTLDAEGKLTESESLAREALALRKRVLGPEHPDYAHSLAELGNVLKDEGKPGEAEAVYRESLGIRRQDFGETNLDVAGTLSTLGGVLVSENRQAEAEPLIREALAIQRGLLPADHQDIAGSLLNLAAVLAQEGKLADAEAAQREALAMQQRVLGEHLNVAISYFNLAFLLEADGKFSEAETNAAQSLALRQKLLGDEHSDVATTMALLGRIRSEQHNFEGAETVQRLEVSIWHKLAAKNSPPLPINVAGLTDSLLRLTETLVSREKYR